MGRKNKPLVRQKTHWSAKPLYVIATEGEVTEKIYFNGAFRRKNIRMPILATKKGNSSPEKVLKRLNKYKTKYAASSDELWLVIDRDNWNKNTLSAIEKECKARGFNLAISNPCFELWLLLHQNKPKQPLTASECDKELKKLIKGYNKSKFNIDCIVENISQAIEHAKVLDNNKNIQDAPSTKVFKLVEKLIIEDDH